MTSIIKIARAGVGLSAMVLVGLFVLHSRAPEQRDDSTIVDSLSVASLEISSSDLQFGKVAVDQSVRRTITLTNSSSNTDLVIDNLFLDELDSLYYSLSKEAPIHLSRGQKVDLEIAFSPTVTGDMPGRLILNHTGDYGTAIIDLHGAGFDSDLNAPVIAAAVPGKYPFGKSKLQGFNSDKPTSLQFGPDGKLYVALMDGSIKVLEIERSSENDYKVISSDTINLVKNIPNHNDDGSKNNSIRERLVSGLLVTGSSTKPVIYIHSSDPRIGGGSSGNKTGLDTNSGILSRLTKNGNNWQKLDLVRGLSRSEENHHGNGLALNAGGDKLYVAAGGNTNMGATSNNFALLPEYALSAAILEIDLAAIGDNTYDLPTLNDEDRTGTNDANDPFGGNRGKNQAKLVAGGPVQVYSPGFRNPYDVVIMENGRMYSWDNGPNSGWGGIPLNNGPQGNCTNGVREPGSTQHDALHLISGEGYYGGHPNPTRGNKNNKFNNSNPQSPVPYSNPVECDYYGPGNNGNGKHSKNKSLVSLPASTNGIAEYTASNFNGDMKGSLLAASWDNTVYRVTFNASGGLVKNEALFSNVGSNPLDVTAQGDNAVFPGTIWVANFHSKSIAVFEPDDYLGTGIIGCFAGDGLEDADGDGFSDADENANETDPCSSADVPPDADFDNISDIIDPDDDNDGLNDLVDPFALDWSNGAATGLGVDYQWENDSESAGFISGLGFSGLMSNATDDYLTQYDTGQMTIRGAAGVLTIDEVSKGDPINGVNTQEYGFQFGINVDSSSPVFRAHTRILAPFAGFTPAPHQSMGLFIGTGDQDNYLKLVVDSTAPSGGLQFSAEAEGARYANLSTSASIVTASYVDLYIEVDPGSAIASAYYQLTEGEHTGDLVEVGGAISFPAEWLENPTKLAVGIISTSVGAQPFPATWDFITVKAVATNDVSSPPEVIPDLPVDENTAADIVYRINAGGPLLPDDGGDWSADNSNESFANTGKTWSSNSDIDLSGVDSALPSSLFQSERYGPSYSPDLQWQLPVTPGDYEVRLYFSENYIGSMASGGRVFSVNVEGHNFQNLDIYAEAGGKTAVMKSVVINSDATIDISFSRSIQNPSIKGIEVRGTSTSSPPVDDETFDNPVVSDPSDTNIPVDEESDPTDTSPPVDDPEAVNKAPVVDTGTNTTTTVSTPLVLSGSASDDGLPGTGTSVSWKKISGPGNVVFESPSALTTTATFSAAGSYQLALDVTDGDLSTTDNLTVVVSAAQTQSNIVYRINAGGPLLADPAGDWQADANGSSYVNTGKIWARSAAVNTSALTVDVPEQLFKTERYDHTSGPELQWSLPVDPGTYEVRLFFAEIYPGTQSEGSRVFSINVEGQSLTNLDVYAQTGGLTAMMESFIVNSDESLDIAFSHVVENPAIKGIEVVEIAAITTDESGPANTSFPVDEPEVLPVVNMSPQVVINASVSTNNGVVATPIDINADVADDGLPEGVLYTMWTRISGPGDVVFNNPTSVSTTATFSKPGDYIIALTVSDGEQATTDTVALTVSGNVTVESGQVVYRINAGGPLLADASGDWIADNSDASYANTGITWSHQKPVDVTAVGDHVPAELFNSDRFDRTADPELAWQLPVTAGDYIVKLYFAETYPGTMAPGARMFDVMVEGEALAGIDVFSEAGGYKALVKTFVVSSDDFLDIAFGHQVQNPSIKGIEILRN